MCVVVVVYFSNLMGIERNQTKKKPIMQTKCVKYSI